MSTHRYNLFEAKAPVFEDDLEQILKDKLIDNLRDDGKGHHHAKYAKRLEKFNVQIVPVEIDPEFTAGIVFDTGIIYIGEGFLLHPSGQNILVDDIKDEETDKAWAQLNVLIRHELAHNLLMHQVRLATALGEKYHLRTKLSQSLHQLKNLISDDEISNRKYTDADKEIVRQMTLNGRLIGGLVTEDHRPEWIKLSVESMYKQICAEINQVHKALVSGKTWSDIITSMDLANDPVHQQIVQTYRVYADTTSDSIIEGDLKTFINNGCRIGDASLKPELVNVIKTMYNIIVTMSPSDDDVKQLINKIAQSSPVKKLDLFGNRKVELYTPEERFIAVEVLKKFRSDYILWYDRVISSLGGLTDEQLQELAALLK